nr:MAG TPA: hypothetical protein [Caudoviricetes sp.]
MVFFIALVIRTERYKKNWSRLRKEKETMIYNDYPAVRVTVLDQNGQEMPEYGIQCEFLTPCLTRSQARVRREMQSEYRTENSKIIPMDRKKRQREREERVETIYSVLTLVFIGISLFLLTLLG